ncbi:MAG: energy transducer TonB [Opitutaceae bacterium]|nr:energy transducer TonB [Opitutaceae bacterium]
MSKTMRSICALLAASSFLLVEGCTTTPPSPTTVASHVSTGKPLLLEPGDRLPVPIFQAPPVYPFKLRWKGISGQATIEFIVDTEGNVREAKVITATQKEFGLAALASVDRWKFKPALHGGRKVNARMTVPISFNIDDPAVEPAGTR